MAQREYTYDVLRRPTARTTSRQGNVVNDTFVHNSRSELASAQVNGETYGYDYSKFIFVVILAQEDFVFLSMLQWLSIFLMRNLHQHSDNPHFCRHHHSKG